MLYAACAVCVCIIPQAVTIIRESANMSVTVRIRQNSLFRKKLNFDDIIKLTDLSYGVCDENFRLMPNKTAEHTLIYDKNRLARGIDLSQDGADIVLMLNLPTSPSEIEKFYEVTEKICKKLKAKYYIREDEKVSLNDTDKFIECDKRGSAAGLQSIQKSIAENETEKFEMFGIYNPISIGIKEITQISNSIDNLEEYLHRLQSADVYYAAPRVYRTEDKLIGIYAIAPDVLSVVPTTPYIVLNQIKGIDEWYVMLLEGKTVKYEDFIRNINPKEYYDADHVIVLLNGSDIIALTDKYSVEL